MRAKILDMTGSGLERNLLSSVPNCESDLCDQKDNRWP